MTRRADLPDGVRAELDRQRKEFVRTVGAEFEDLIDRKVDPTPAVVATLNVFAAVKAAAER